MALEKTRGYVLGSFCVNFLARGSVAGMLDSALLRLGIDDLAKFRILQLVCTNPAFHGTAEDFAETLGFRSNERTGLILAELAERGLLDRKLDGFGQTLFCLTRQAAGRRALIEAGLSRPASPADAGLLGQLARLSLKRVRPRRRRRQPAGAEAV